MNANLYKDCAGCCAFVLLVVIGLPLFFAFPKCDEGGRFQPCLENGITFPCTRKVRGVEYCTTMTIWPSYLGSTMMVTASSLFLAWFLCSSDYIWQAFAACFGARMRRTKLVFHVLVATTVLLVSAANVLLTMRPFCPSPCFPSQTGSHSLWAKMSSAKDWPSPVGPGMPPPPAGTPPQPLICKRSQCTCPDGCSLEHNLELAALGTVFESVGDAMFFSLACLFPLWYWLTKEKRAQEMSVQEAPDEGQRLLSRV